MDSPHAISTPSGRIHAVLDSGDHERDFRSSVVAGLALVLAIMGLAIVVDDILAREYLTATAIGILPCAMLVTGWLLFWRQNLSLAAVTLVMAFYATVAAVLVISGGHAAGAYVALPAIVLVACLVTEQRVAAAATIACILLALLGIWLTTRSWQFPVVIDEQRFIWGMARLSMVICTLNLVTLALFRKTSDRTRARLVDAQADTQKANRSLSDVLDDHRSTIQLLFKLQEIGKVSGWWFDPRTNRVHHTLESEAGLYEFELDDTNSEATSMGLTRSDLRALIAEVMVSDDNWDHEIRRVDSAGAEAWFRSIGAVERRNGQAVKIVGVLNDVTQARVAQQQRAQSQKLEAIGTLAAGVAHEINTPIQFVGDNVAFLNQSVGDLCECVGAISALLARDGELDIAAFKKDLRTIIEDADVDFVMEELPRALTESMDGLERMRNIVLAMKAFAHPGNQQKSMADLNKAVQSTLLVCANRWKRTADMTTAYASNLPLALCTLNEINQAVLNIVVNASDAIQEKIDDGSIQRGKIHVDTSCRDGIVEIRISDNGPGIPESIREKIFEPFFTTKEVGKGTGQGLAISYDIVVNRHGGELICESAPEGGTTFRICLPTHTT